MKQFIVCTSPFLLEEGLNLIPNFQKGGLDRTLLFREGVAGKEGWGVGGGVNCARVGSNI